MSQMGETFFTRIGCMGGRVQIRLPSYGQKKFDAKYPDTITEAGKVGILVNNPTPEFLAQVKKKIDISVTIHHSKGILVPGHQECAGHPVGDEQQKKDILKSVEIIRSLTPKEIPVIPVFVKRSAQDPMVWEVEELK